MKLSKKEVISFGKIQSLSKMAFIAINEKLCIEHINTYAKKLLSIKDDNSLIGKSIKQVFEQLNLQPLINTKGEIIDKGLILVDDCFQKWEKSSVTVENEKWMLLIGYLVNNNKLLNSCFKKFKKDLQTKDVVYLNNMLENLPELVYWKDSNCLYQGCNKNAADLLNYNSPKEIIGKSDHDLAHEFGWSKERIKRLQEIDSSIIKKGIRIVEEDIIPINGIKKIYLTSKTPLHNKNNEVIGILGISTDISERKKMEEELHIAKDAAEAANTAKSEFLANMSHDIRTPLAGVVGMSELLENDLQNSRQINFAHMLHDSSEELLGLLNHIIDDVRAGNFHEDDIQLEVFSLQQCVQHLVKLELPTTKLKSLDLQVDIDKELPSYIEGDQIKLHRILLNLMGNAIKFTESGSILIKIKCLNKDHKKAHIQFEVTDTGIGIPKDKQDKVFDRFFRVTPSYKGLYKGHGLGLHIAQSYVKLLGGDITLTSKEGVGTTFKFDLQFKVINRKPEEIKDKGVSAISSSDTKVMQKTNASTPHILLVEDSPIALKVVENIVENEGWRFISAVDGEQALELSKSNDFDLIITDIGLPGISGHEFTQYFREWETLNNKKPTPVIGLTGHAREAAQNECLECGMNDVFTKPASPALLQELVNRFVAPDHMSSLQTLSIDKSSGNLGLDLPDSEDELFKLNSLSIFVPSQVLEQMGGDETAMLNILRLFVAETPKNIALIQEAYNDGDLDKMEFLAHKMKSGATYCSVPKMKLACQYLERYRKAGHVAMLDKLYHQLIDVTKTTNETVEKWLQNK